MTGPLLTQYVSYFGEQVSKSIHHFVGTQCFCVQHGTNL